MNIKTRSDKIRKILRMTFPNVKTQLKHGNPFELLVATMLSAIGEGVVPTKQCGSIISMSYISYLLAAHSEKPGVYKVKQGSIPKPALLCRDYQKAI